MEIDVTGFEQPGRLAVIDWAREKVREFLRASRFAPGATMTFAIESDVPTFRRLFLPVFAVLARLLSLGWIFARPPSLVIVLLHRLHEFAFVIASFLLRGEKKKQRLKQRFF